jgi:hypothetical protein
MAPPCRRPRSPEKTVERFEGTRPREGENERVVSDKQTHRPRRDDGRAGNAGRGSEMPKNQWSMTVPVAVRFAEWIGQGMLIRIMRIAWRCPSA